MPDATLAALLSLASHELRQPTGVVRGYLRALDQDPTINQRVRKGAEIDEAQRSKNRNKSRVRARVECLRLQTRGPPDSFRVVPRPAPCLSHIIAHFCDTHPGLHDERIVPPESSSTGR